MSTIPEHESHLPPVLMVADMAKLLGMSPRGLLNARKRRTWVFPELPKMDRFPRWSRDAVLAKLNGGIRVR